MSHASHDAILLFIVFEKQGCPATRRKPAATNVSISISIASLWGRQVWEAYLLLPDSPRNWRRGMAPLAGCSEFTTQMERMSTRMDR